MTSSNPRDAISNVLHGANFAAYTRGAEARMHGHPLPYEVTGISDECYWFNEGWHLRAFAPLTSDHDYRRIARHATTNHEGVSA